MDKPIRILMTALLVLLAAGSAMGNAEGNGKDCTTMAPAAVPNPSTPGFAGLISIIALVVVTRSQRS